MSKSASVYRNPLDRFLEIEPDDPDNLTLCAKRLLAEPFDPDSFGKQLIAKLKQVQYFRGKRRPPKTCYDLLVDAGVLDEFVRQETLHEIRKCMLLKTIVEHERQKKAFDGQPLQVHTEKARQIWSDLGVIGKIVERHGAREEATSLYETLNRKYMHHLRTLLMSTKFKGSRAVLLSGQVRKSKRNSPRDEDVATKVAIYRTLKQRLQTKEAKRKGLTDIFLRQLSELIWAPDAGMNLGDGSALYRAVKRSRKS